jgi:HNH endonuclease
MWRVKKPTRSTLETFRTCIREIDNENLKGRLEQIEVTVVREGQVYDAAATNGQLHTLTRAKSIDDLVTVSEMSDLYKLQFSKQGSPGRGIYDELITATKNGRCPMCGQGVVSTLDHYLPKSRYPCLTVTPLNLIPACSDCNKKKLSSSPGAADEAILHPYFDDVEQDRWLGAETLEGKPAVVRFFVRSVERWDEVKQARMQRHFKTLKLAALYASNAADELQNLRLGLSRIFRSGGVDGVQAHLRDAAESRAAVHVNSWQTAMYTALVGSDWYCRGGFE